jgi:hypothetical protein
MQGKTIAVKTCNDIMEANIVKAKLESYGVECFITNANFSTLMPVFNNMLGGMVKIYVMENNEKIARELLDETEQKTTQVSCPECYSTNVKYGFGKKKILKIFSMLLSFLVLIPLMPNLYTYHCRDCGCEFKNS